MVELIIEETGFPKNREELTEFQQSFQKPIQELLDRLPGNRILSGFVWTTTGATSTATTGVLLYRGKLWTIEAYSGSSVGVSDLEISFFEGVELLTFNVGTQADPIYQDRPGKIVRTARVGTHPGRTYGALMSSFIRGRQQLEYLKSGSVFTGVIVYNIGATILHINFGRNIGTKDYQVLGNFRALNADENFSRAFTWDINNRKHNGFDVIINNVTAPSVPLVFDYTVIPINRPGYISLP
ncbi:hypothetical protein EI546_06635 [Aequorivita sp. H23M31]|uniref:Uncharacterized protein n=1 Tax=Aequorivita ciconiae TaxID=2494375 RepID=A0A410G2D9_9FLAO|nr:hypothetical protein [Aequorivita sp. H23M31]QAA81426.1 hypothetical protein EI546_06635 [Aequorivita sp. H23M31]